MSLTSFTDNNDWLERSFALVDDDADAEHQPRKPIDLLCTEDPGSAACVAALEPVPAPRVIPVSVSGSVPATSPLPLGPHMMMGDQPSVSGSGSTSAMKENVAIVPRRRAVVRVTNDAGEVVDLSNLAQRAEAVTAAAAATATATATATAKKSGVAAPFGPRPHSRHVLTPDDAIARLATDLKNANVAICGAFLQRELLAHQSEWEADESAGTSVVAAWPLTQTMKRFIAALHDKFPPKKEGQCDGAVRAWVRQLIVAVDAAQLAGAQRKRADALLTKTLEEIGTNKN